VIEKSTVPIKTAEALARVLSSNEEAKGGKKFLGSSQLAQFCWGRWDGYGFGFNDMKCSNCHVLAND